MFVLYPESQQPAIDYIQANWPCAWALHDKDTHTEQEFLDYGKHHDGNCPDWQIGDLKKPHYHFVVKFKNARYITGVAKEIRKYSEINDAAIKKCYNLYKAYVYLWHQNDPDKFQYDPEQVVGLHDFDPPQQNEGVTEEEQVETMFNAPVFSTVKELARWAYFLNTLMCCRHYHISFYGSAQRFQHVDKMLRDVTMNVVQCKKVWRFQFNSYYDGFQLENAQDPTLVRPLRRACWFVTDADYNAYDTLQVVDNLQKSFNENDMLTEAEILANQAAPAPVGMDAVTPSRKAKKIMREKVNR